MNISTKLHNIRVVIVTHEYATGPSHALEAYLRGKVAKLAFVAHPFVFAREKRSHIRVSGKKEYFFPLTIPVQFLSLIKDVLLTVWWCLRFGTIDVYVGVDNINASVGIVLQKIGLVNKTIFYTIDYIPNRFNNPFLNAIYHRIDAFAVTNVDMVWNLSMIMKRERAKVGLSSPKVLQKQILVPMGTEGTVSQCPFSKIKRYHLVHMGHLTRKQGVQSVIKALPRIVEHLPEFHLDIIGGGPMENELSDMVRKLRMDRCVTFYGFIKNHDDVEALMAQSAAAIAPYVESPDNIIRFTDPGKVKAYLSVGLPIIITKVPDIWKIIVQNRAGMAVSDSPADLANAIVSLLSNENILREMRMNAQQLGKKYTWSKIFDKALRAI